MSAEESRDFGLVDEVVENRPTTSEEEEKSGGRA